MASDQTAQLGLGWLGQLQLGMAGDGGAVPPVVVPEMSTWYIALSQPARPIIEVEGY